MYETPGDVARGLRGFARDPIDSAQLAQTTAQLKMESQLKTVDLMLRQAKNLTDQLIANAEAKLRTGTQLTASSMSAVGYNANVSASVSASSGCQTSFNFNGETADA